MGIGGALGIGGSCGHWWGMMEGAVGTRGYWGGNGGGEAVGIGEHWGLAGRPSPLGDMGVSRRQ